MLYGHDEGKNIVQLCNGSKDVVCIAKGGTGANNAAGARANLGLGSVATENVLPVSKGGTGATTAAAIGLMAYPVGAVYISYNSTSPAELFGGTWTPITGVFPYFNAGTAKGGSNTHTLTIAEMPSHNHKEAGWNISYKDGISKVAASGSVYSWGANNGYSTDATGGGGAHNNMPAYQTFYAWRRTA